MKKIMLLLLATTHIAVAGNMERREVHFKPMIEGNLRAQETLEWLKLHPGVMPPLTEQEKYEIFTRNGMPLPGQRAKVVNNNMAFKFTKTQSAIINKFNASQKSQGYYEMNNEKAKTLLDMPDIAEKEYNERKDIAYNPQDTHLYEVKSNLMMSYPYEGVSPNLVIKVIGYTPEHSFIETGWTGATEFFIPQFDAVCAYHEVNIELTGSSAYIPKEVVTYTINNKITKINAAGSKESGFAYQVEWWGDKFKKTLECASKDYSETTKNNVIALAKSIDSQ